MRRREFIIGVLSASTTGLARGQRSAIAKVHRIAIVDPSLPATDMGEKSSHRGIRAFFEELRLLGYVEDQNLLIERFSGEGRAVDTQTTYYPGLAHDVVHR